MSNSNKDLLRLDHPACNVYHPEFHGSEASFRLQRLLEPAPRKPAIQPIDSQFKERAREFLTELRLSN